MFSTAPDPPPPPEWTPASRASRHSRLLSFLHSRGPKPPLEPAIPIPGLPGIMSNDGVAVVFSLDPRTQKKSRRRAVSMPLSRSSSSKEKETRKEKGKASFLGFPLPLLPKRKEEDPIDNFEAFVKRRYKNKEAERNNEMDFFLSRRSSASSVGKRDADRLPKHSNVFTGVPTPTETATNSTRTSEYFPSKPGSPVPELRARERMTYPGSYNSSLSSSSSLGAGSSTSKARKHYRRSVYEVPGNSHGELLRMPSASEPQPFKYPGATPEQVEAYERAAEAARAAARPSVPVSYPNDAVGSSGSFLFPGGPPLWIPQPLQSGATNIPKHPNQQKSMSDRRPPTNTTANTTRKLQSTTTQATDHVQAPSLGEPKTRHLQRLHRDEGEVAGNIQSTYPPLQYPQTVRKEKETGKRKGHAPTSTSTSRPHHPTTIGLNDPATERIPFHERYSRILQSMGTDGEEAAGRYRQSFANVRAPGDYQSGGYFDDLTTPPLESDYIRPPLPPPKDAGRKEETIVVNTLWLFLETMNLQVLGKLPYVGEFLIKLLVFEFSPTSTWFENVMQVLLRIWYVALVTWVVIVVVRVLMVLAGVVEVMVVVPKMILGTVGRLIGIL
ncbi:hypothetical protein RUND412_001847 [Rhizina undulata]